MKTLCEIVLQIKDKNVIWKDKAEEVYFKKKKILFFYATYTYCPDACPNCGCVNHDNSIVKMVLVLLELLLIKFLDYLPFLNEENNAFSAVNAPIVYR